MTWVSWRTGPVLAVLVSISVAGGISGLAASWARAADAGSAELAALPANQWVAFAAPKDIEWRRQGHAGAAYDSKRGTLLLFGSNTHGEDWDNSVHEFDPATKRWSTHYAPAAPGTYRADAAGNRVAGPEDRPQPWAMHTYDGVVYDPTLDVIWVSALPGHNPIVKKVPEARRNPLWMYDLSDHSWRMFDGGGKPVPAIFLAAAAYDSRRDTVVFYGGNGSSLAGMFELGPDRKSWRQVAPTHHEIHFNMDYDDRHGLLAVFGDYGDSSKAWIYRPHPNPGRSGRWEERMPEGDKCAPSQSTPLAFDGKAGVFLMVPKGVTCVYDPETNRQTRLPDAKIPPLEEPYSMNYNMVYDVRHGVFLLVTGSWRAPPVVWALKLDLGAL